MWEFIIYLALAIANALLAKAPAGAEASSMSDNNLPVAEDGLAVPIVLGTCKVTGPNVTWWGDLKTVAMQARTSGFFGIGAKKYTTGYKYYIGMQMCIGTKIDALLDIVADDISMVDAGHDVARDYAAVGATISVDANDLFGGDQSEGGLKGDLAIYFGSLTQTGNAYLTEKWGSTAPGYRGISYLVFESMYIGTAAYLKTFAPIVRHCPCPEGMSGAYANINGDANPSHGIVYLLTTASEQGGLGLSMARINLTSFNAAAKTLYNEGIGISILIDTYQSADTWIAGILQVIDGVIYTDPSTGLWTLKLIRQDYDEADLLSFGPSDIKSLEIQVPTWPNTYNRVVVKYTDRGAGFVTKTAQAKDAANRAIQGFDVCYTQEYAAVSNSTAAVFIACREMQGRAYPLVLINNLVTNRKAWELRPGSPFKLTWPDSNIESMVFRVAKIRYGTLADGRITLDAVQDIFGTPSITTEAPTGGWVNPLTAPEPASCQMVMEAPYGVVGESIDILICGSRGDKTTQSMDVMVDQGAGYIDCGTLDAPTPTGVLLSAWSAKTAAMDATGFTVCAGVDLDTLPQMSTTDTGLAYGVNLALIGSEIVSWKTAAHIAEDRYQVTNIMRGVLDTVPEDHTPGDRVWFLSQGVTAPESYGEGDSSTPSSNIASATQLGEIMVGDNLSIDGDGVLSAVITGTSRDTDFWTTNSLSANASETADRVLCKGSKIYRVVTDKPARVRLYSTSAARTADASRNTTTFPAVGAGVMLDVITNAVNLSIPIEQCEFTNLDDPAADIGYWSITNLGSTAQAVTVTITHRPEEA